jgi:hypothetical protein
MPKMTAGYAKNTIRRALRAVVDREPSLSEIAKLWEYFGSACAYCSRRLTRENREGHLDHLLSGGSNHISNRVLSCGLCNGDEKRDKNWIDFLREKTSDATSFNQRRSRIEAWYTLVAQVAPKHEDEMIEVEIERAVSAFDAAVAKLRQLRQRIT